MLKILQCLNLQDCKIYEKILQRQNLQNCKNCVKMFKNKIVQIPKEQFYKNAKEITQLQFGKFCPKEILILGIQVRL